MGDRESDWLRRLQASWRARDSEAIGALFTEDVVYKNSPFRPSLLGREAVIAYWDAELAETLSVDVNISARLVDGGRAAVTWWAVVDRREGQSTETGVLLLEFEGPLCSRLDEYWMLSDGAIDPPGDPGG